MACASSGETPDVPAAPSGPRLPQFLTLTLRELTEQLGALGEAPGIGDVAEVLGLAARDPDAFVDLGLSGQRASRCAACGAEGPQIRCNVPVSDSGRSVERGYCGEACMWAAHAYPRHAGRHS